MKVEYSTIENFGGMQYIEHVERKECRDEYTAP